MQWDDDRRQLVSKLLADGCTPDEIAERFGVTARAVYAGMHKFGLGEDVRGTRVFLTARGAKIRKQVKPRKPAKVSLAPVTLGREP